MISLFRRPLFSDKDSVDELSCYYYIVINILFCPLYLLMGIFCYCLGFLGDPVYEQLHSESPEQETKKDKK